MEPVRRQVVSPERGVVERRLYAIEFDRSQGMLRTSVRNPDTHHFLVENRVAATVRVACYFRIASTNATSSREELAMRVRPTDDIDREPIRGVSWEHIDMVLQTFAKRRGVLDAREAKWLREAVRVRIWREVGCVSIGDYLERRLGYAPRTARDRIRVAMALGELPGLEAALEDGLSHSAVRALTRVCTNDNEQKWLDKVRGKTVHEIENLVAGRARGADPGDPPEPNLIGRTLPFEDIRPATEALLRDARRLAQDEAGTSEFLSDDDLLWRLARAFLDGGSPERTKAPYQIAVSVCEKCGQGWQESGGRSFALSPADKERACCDAEWIGSVDTGIPERARQDVSPSVRRLVQRRARGRCELPGCRSTRCLEIHHIVPRSEGGGHDPENLIVLCDGCHSALHRGLIKIAGTASNLLVSRRYEFGYMPAANDEAKAADSSMSVEMSAHVSHESSRFERERLRSDARKALVGLGFRSGEAGKAVDVAMQCETTLEEVIRVALRSCAKQ